MSSPWRDAGCSVCLGPDPDRLGPGGVENGELVVVPGSARLSSSTTDGEIVATRLDHIEQTLPYVGSIADYEAWRPG